MKVWNVIKKIISLPLWLMIILDILSAAGLAAVFVNGYETHPLSSVVYALSFYALACTVYVCIVRLPGYIGRTKAMVYKNKYASRYFSDKEFKTHVNLYRSLAFNLIYVAINAVSAAVYDTAWFAIFAIYYAIMAIMRFLLVRFVGKTGLGKSRYMELRRTRLCAYIMMSVNLVLSGAVLMMAYSGRGFEYRGMLIYVMAAYAFYMVVSAIVELVRYRKYNSPVMSMSKVIKLASALFSLLMLETAMFAQFGGEMSAGDQRIMIMATGAGISAVVVTLSVYMSVKATKEIKERRRIK